MVSFAKQMIEGDKKAVEAGYPAMANPSVDELQEAVDRASKEINDVTPADRAYDMAQEEISKLRPTADEMIKDVIAELNLRKKDDPSKRRIMGTYSVEFIYKKGESKDSPLDEDSK